MQEFDKNKSYILTKTLGSLIKKHRTNQDKTIYKISAEAGMSKSTWREAELGIGKNITLTTLWKIAEGLDIAPFVLLEELSKEIGSDFTLIEND